MSDGYKPIPRKTEETGRSVVDAALSVHPTLGPGLLESCYEACLARELEERGHTVVRQKALPVVYEGLKLETGYRIDLMIDGVIIVEVKSADELAPIHEAQLLTYLKLSSRRLGFLINFNVPLLKQGLRRIIL